MCNKSFLNHKFMACMRRAQKNNLIKWQNSGTITKKKEIGRANKNDDEHENELTNINRKNQNRQRDTTLQDIPNVRQTYTT